MPPRQAQTISSSMAFALSVLAVAARQPAVGTCFLLCFVALLRVREALNLRRRDVIDVGSQIVLILGQTKRGLEQKS